MGPISFAVLDRVGSMGPGIRVLDIAAGAGALSVPAAHSVASVLAIDNAPGMVRRLADRLAPFPACEVRLMDGQALELDDGSLDAVFSIVGVSIFADWRRGMRELTRVLRPGGKAGLACWRSLPGGGPFNIMAQALKAVFPDRAPPAPPDGFVALADPVRLEAELRGVGLADVVVEEIDAFWEGPAGEAYLEELRELHPFMGPYALLEEADRRKVDAVILSLVNEVAVGHRVTLRSSVLIATGSRI